MTPENQSKIPNSEQKFAVRVENLKKTYEEGKTMALDGITFEVPEGMIFGLLGPNGAGKSTTIGILCGLVKKSEGNAYIFDYETTENAFDARMNLGVVQQEVPTEPVFTVEEALYYVGGFYGVSKEDRRKRIPEILEALGLTDKKDTRANRLSGGMKRRLMVAKALVHNPKVLILDEPTAGVDIELRRKIWDYVREINRRGTTIIFTTHYLEEAEELCENIAIINKGKIIANDSLANLRKFFGDNVIEFHLKDKTKTVADLAKHLDGGKLTFDETTKKFHLAVKQDELPHYLKLIAGLDVQDLNILRSDLEDIFMKLIKKDA